MQRVAQGGKQFGEQRAFGHEPLGVRALPGDPVADGEPFPAERLQAVERRLGLVPGMGILLRLPSGEGVLNIAAEDLGQVMVTEELVLVDEAGEGAGDFDDRVHDCPPTTAATTCR
jgi:hypothetical protein